MAHASCVQEPLRTSLRTISTLGPRRANPEKTVPNVVVVVVLVVAVVAAAAAVVVVVVEGSSSSSSSNRGGNNPRAPSYLTSLDCC